MRTIAVLIILPLAVLMWAGNIIIMKEPTPPGYWRWVFDLGWASVKTD